jgi:hypothetical protein
MDTFLTCKKCLNLEWCVLLVLGILHDHFSIVAKKLQIMQTILANVLFDIVNLKTVE